MGFVSHAINNPNSLVNNNVNKIVQDKSGNIWMATDNGISCKEAGTGRWKTFYQNQHNQAPVFISLCEDDKGRIWAGTYSSGIFVLDERTGCELAHYSKETYGSALDNNFVLDIFKDSNGDLWIGGGSGKMICYLSKENKFRKYSTMPINAFAELAPNKILLACTYGLCILDKKTGVIKTLQEGYLVHELTGFFSPDGVKWMPVGNKINVEKLDRFTSNYNGWCGNRQGLYVQGTKYADFDLYIYRDAYSPILAECPANQYGTIKTVLSGGGALLDDIHNNDWALYAGVEFGNKNYNKESGNISISASCLFNFMA